MWLCASKPLRLHGILGSNVESCFVVRRRLKPVIKKAAGERQ